MEISNNTTNDIIKLVINSSRHESLPALIVNLHFICNMNEVFNSLGNPFNGRTFGNIMYDLFNDAAIPPQDSNKITNTLKLLCYIYKQMYTKFKTLIQNPQFTYNGDTVFRSQEHPFDGLTLNEINIRTTQQNASTNSSYQIATEKQTPYIYL